MKRRTFLTEAGTLAALIASSATVLAETKSTPSNTMASKDLEALVATTFDCLRAGEDCLRHCGDRLAVGDKTMGECNRAVQNMLALCGAMAKVATYASAEPNRIRHLAAVCGDVCRDCAKACRPHESHHASCKSCMETCQACAKACAKVTVGLA